MIRALITDGAYMCKEQGNLFVGGESIYWMF